MLQGGRQAVCSGMGTFTPGLLFQTSSPVVTPSPPGLVPKLEQCRTQGGAAATGTAWLLWEWNGDRSGHFLFLFPTQLSSYP